MMGYMVGKSDLWPTANAHMLQNMLKRGPDRCMDTRVYEKRIGIQCGFSD